MRHVSTVFGDTSPVRQTRSGEKRLNSKNGPIKTIKLKCQVRSENEIETTKHERCPIMVIWGSAKASCCKWPHRKCQDKRCVRADVLGTFAMFEAQVWPLVQGFVCPSYFYLTRLSRDQFMSVIEPLVCAWIKMWNEQKREDKGRSRQNCLANVWFLFFVNFFSWWWLFVGKLVK